VSSLLSGAPAGSSSSRGATLLVAAFAVAAFSIGLGLGAIGPSLPSMHDRLHAPLGSLGLLLGGEYVGSLLATLAFGPLLDHRSPRPLIVGGLLLTALGFALVPLANGLGLAVAALTLAGAGVGIQAVGAPVLIARQGGRQEGRALSIVNMAFGAGAFLGPLCAGWALDNLHDYRPIFYGFSATLALPLLLLTPLHLPPPRARIKARGGSLPSGVWLLTLLLAAVSFCYLAAEVGFGSWAYSYVRATTHASVNCRLGGGRRLLAGSEREQPCHGPPPAKLASGQGNSDRRGRGGVRGPAVLGGAHRPFTTRGGGPGGPLPGAHISAQPGRRGKSLSSHRRPDLHPRDL